MAHGVARKRASGSRDIRTKSNGLRARCSGCDWGVIRVDRYIRRSHKTNPSVIRGLPIKLLEK